MRLYALLELIAFTVLVALFVKLDFEADQTRTIELERRRRLRNYHRDEPDCDLPDEYYDEDGPWQYQ